MRADRLLSILLILQTKGRVTAGELARRLEVSERTIYRDLDALTTAGVPVYGARGPGGGCALLEDYCTDLTGLSKREVHALSMFSAPGPLADLGISKDLERALIKLTAALPSAYRRNAERVRERVYCDTTVWFRAKENAPQLATLQDALWHDRVLRLRYRRRTGEVAERYFAPYGLVAKAGVWYLVGATRGEMRVYRVSRVLEAEVTAATFLRPDDFDLGAYWRAWCEAFETQRPKRMDVRARVAPQASERLPVFFGEGVRAAYRAAPADALGWRTMAFSFDSLEHARNVFLSLGVMAEVLEPALLRQSVAETAEAVAAFYRRLPAPAPSYASARLCD